MSSGSNRWRWSGAAIGGVALALGVFALLGILISPRIPVQRADRIAGFYRLIICHVWGVPVRGLVVTRNPDHSISGVPEALFCDADAVSPDGCTSPVGKSGSEGSFDFTVRRVDRSFHRGAAGEDPGGERSGM